MRNKRILIILFSLLLSACDKPDAYDVNGEKFYLKKLGDKWLVLNYWAHWCPPCVEEIAELNLLQQSHQQQLQVVGVHYNLPQPQQLQAMVQKLNINFLALQNDISTQLSVPVPEVIPTTYVIDPNGNLKATLVGPQTTSTILAVLN